MENMGRFGSNAAESSTLGLPSLSCKENAYPAELSGGLEVTQKSNPRIKPQARLRHIRLQNLSAF
ncbi:hypothetical protein SAMN04488135_102145 [Pollutimonas bauzanensis]|uniref:Uncharacterized protein n=1 Tax=Pollutimonas bauzanensis TaxID=658167 RepID=A0A1M5Q2M4_9BURK|nr:hypothetical protein SAMN04488135_102145 [Pollutimonas bauzanensis]